MCGIVGTSRDNTHSNMGDFKKIHLTDFKLDFVMNIDVWKMLKYCHVAMCISATCATCTTNGTNLTMAVTQLENGVYTLQIEF